MAIEFPQHITLCQLNAETNIMANPVFSDDGKMSYVYESELVEFIANALKFSFTIRNPSDGKVGTPSMNGSWDGLIGMLQRRECDMAIEALAITQERMDVLSYTYPFYITDTTFLANNPEPLPKSLTIIHPFSYQVWIVSAAIFFIVSLCIYGMNYKITSYLRTLFMLFCILTEQTFNFKSKRTSGRLLLFSWISGAMFLTFSYKAVLLSFLSFPPLQGVRNIPELSKAVSKGSHICKTWSGTFYMDAFKKLDDSLKVIALSLKENSHTTVKPEDFLLSLVHKKGAFVDLRLYISPLKDLFFLSEDSFFLTMIGLATEKEFCCKTALNKVIKKMYEGGIYKKILNDRDVVLSIKLQPIKPIEKSEKAISLEDTLGVFILLFVGYALGLSALIAEIMFHRTMT